MMSEAPGSDVLVERSEGVWLVRGVGCWRMQDEGWLGRCSVTE
jgi:hypothetical protein